MFSWKKTKSIPPAPKVEEQGAFLEWLMRYGRDFELLRRVYPSNLDKVITLFLNGAQKELKTHDSAASLREWTNKLHSTFHESLFPLLKNDFSNVFNVDPQVQAAVMEVYVKMTLFDYILLYKYNDRLQAGLQAVMPAAALQDIYGR